MDIQLNASIKEAIKEALHPLYSEIANLKSIIISQNLKMNALIGEIHSLKKNNNINTSVATAERNSIEDNSEKLTVSYSGVTELPLDVELKKSQPDEENLTSSEKKIIETKDDVDAAGWKIVKSKKKKSNQNQKETSFEVPKLKKRNNMIIGSSKSTTLISAPKKSLFHIHVSRLDPSTTVEDFHRFVNETITDFTCEKLKSKQPDIYSSFKLSFPSVYASKLNDPTFWPEGVTVNKFFLRRRPAETVHP